MFVCQRAVLFLMQLTLTVANCLVQSDCSVQIYFTAASVCNTVIKCMFYKFSVFQLQFRCYLVADTASHVVLWDLCVLEGLWALGILSQSIQMIHNKDETRAHFLTFLL